MRDDLPARSRIARLLSCCLAATLCCAGFAHAAPTSGITAESMWMLARLSEPAISPDGRWTVVPVTRYDMDENKGRTVLWLFPTNGGAAPRALTSPLHSASEPAWSPDGKRILFLSRRDEDNESQVYVLPIEGGDARRITAVPTGANAPRWFPDGRRIAFVTPIWTDLVRWEDQQKRLAEREAPKMTAQTWERAPIAYWDHYLDEREPHLFSVSVDGGEPAAISRLSGFHLSKNEYSRSSYDISPDGLEVAFVAEVGSGTEPNDDVVVIPACGCKPAQDITAANRADDGSPAYSADGRFLAYTRKTTTGFYADRDRVMLRERASGKVFDLSGAWDRSAGELVWLPGSRSLLTTVEDAGTNRVYRFDIDRPGMPRALTTAPSFGNVAVADAAGRSAPAVTLRQSFNEPPTLVRLDLASGAATVLSHFNDDALGSMQMGKVESVTYAGAAGAPIQMWVVYPADFDPAKKYPVFMLLHGGPHNGIQDAVQWRWNAAVFANWGYIVTWHNFHGSSGFGQQFADSINPDRITMPYEDTLKAADWLVSRPFVDPARMIAGGGSYGGFLAATLLGRPHPFKALIAHAAVYDIFTQIGADYGAEKERFFEFWEKPAEFARYSPHTNAGSFTTPTLVIHGGQDRRVPLNHGVELFNTLQKRGVPSKLIYFPDENHWVLKPQNSIFWYRSVREWVEKYAPPGGR